MIWQSRTLTPGLVAVAAARLSFSFHVQGRCRAETQLSGELFRTGVADRSLTSIWRELLHFHQIGAGSGHSARTRPLPERSLA